MEFNIINVYIFICLTTLLYLIIKEIQEVLFLKKTLFSIIGSYRINNIDNLIKIKNYLNITITYDSSKKKAKRPILRHTSKEVLLNKYGFCGENARVAIKLLIIGGLKANRIYLYGEKWGHVVLENKWEKEWYLFDGHYDPLTKMNDSDILNIKSEDLASYPNGYKENNYIDFCRIKQLKKIKILERFSKKRLHILIVYLFESPNLIKLILNLPIMLIGILFLNSI